MKKPRKKKPRPPKPRNAAARALADPLFRPRVVRNPNAYRRKGKGAAPAPDPSEETGEDN